MAQDLIYELYYTHTTPCSSSLYLQPDSFQCLFNLYLCMLSLNDCLITGESCCKNREIAKSASMRHKYRRSSLKRYSKVRGVAQIDDSLLDDFYNSQTKVRHFIIIILSGVLE